jgi:hypothetical protein
LQIEPERITYGKLQRKELPRAADTRGKVEDIKAKCLFPELNANRKACEHSETYSFTQAKSSHKIRSAKITTVPHMENPKLIAAPYHELIEPVK